MVEFSYARDDKYNLAYIGATVLNYVLTCLADVCATKKKIQKHGYTVRVLITRPLS